MTVEPSSIPLATQRSAATQGGKAKRKLLAADSEDDDIPVRPLKRGGTISNNTQPVPPSTNTRTNRSRIRSPSPAMSETVPPATATPAATGRIKRKLAAMASVQEEQDDAYGYDPYQGPRATGHARQRTSATTSSSIGARSTEGSRSRQMSVTGDSTLAENQLLPMAGTARIASRAGTTRSTNTPLGPTTMTGRTSRKRMMLGDDDEGDDQVSCRRASQVANLIVQQRNLVTDGQSGTFHGAFPSSCIDPTEQ